MHMYYLLFSLSIILFLYGYLSIDNVFSEQNTILFEQNTSLSLDHYNSSQYDTDENTITRCIIFLEDGARPDFLFGNASYKKWKPAFTSILDNNKKHAICSLMKVDPPTSTTQGIKTVLTGSYPGFIQLGQTFSSPTLTSDHLLKQLHRKGLKIRHIGDPIWRELAGPVFANKANSIDSFNVYEDDSDAIQHELEDFIASSDTDILIVHSLLVDHNAHKTGSSSPSNPYIYRSLLQFNHHISYLIDHFPNNTMLFVFGDHGLSKWGNHGGATYDEVTTACCVYSSGYTLRPFTRIPHIRDLTSTLSYLFNVPLPYSNIGYHCDNILPNSHQIDRIKDNVYQIQRYYSHYRLIKPSSPLIPLPLHLSYESALHWIHLIQNEVNNTNINYIYCFIAICLMVYCINHSSLLFTLRDYCHSLSFSLITSFLCILLYCCCFTSYHLLIKPSYFPFIVTLFTLILLYPSINLFTFLFILIPMLLPVSLPRSAFIFLLLLPFIYATSPLHYILICIEDCSVLYWVFQSQDQPSTLPAILCALTTLLLCYSYPFLFLSSFMLLMVVINGYSSSSSFFSLFISCIGIRQLPKQSILSPLVAMSTALHYTYQITPTFSFTSIRWAPAFVFTHQTCYTIQSLSMVSSIFFAYIAIAKVMKKEYLLQYHMIIVMISAISVLFNTASPVIWSVYTPLFLYVSVLWFTLLVCFFICYTNDD